MNASAIDPRHIIFSLQIPLLGETLFIDLPDWEKAKHISWSFNTNKLAHTQYLKNTTLNTTLARFILDLPPLDPRKVDHINGNGMDVRRCNLRIATFADDHKNIRITVGKTRNGVPKAAKYKGVYPDVREGRATRYVCRISIKNKVTYIGTFDSEIEAAKAYNEAALLHYGEFANINLFEEGGE